MREEVFQAAIVQQRIPLVGQVLLKEMWSRDVAKLSKSACGRGGQHTSRKMGRRIEPGRWSTERLLSELYERDPTVLGYWYSPFEYVWRTYDSNGRPTGRRQHHPMFTVLRAAGFSVVDFHSGSEIFRRWEADRYYVLDPVTHEWRWLTAEQEYSKVKLAYEVRSMGSVPRVLLDNAKDLDRYHHDNSIPLSPDECSRVLAAFKSVGFMTIRECIDGHGLQAETVRKAVDSGLVAFDLINDRLDSTESIVFRDYDLLEAWRSLRNPGKALLLPGN